MKLCLYLPLLAIVATGQSHPSWWTYASPEATALVGIRWETLRHSPFADAVADELAPGGSLRFPPLALLNTAREVIISSPALLAIVTGNFPAAPLRDQARKAGMTAANYHGIALWIHPAKDTLSLAVIGEELILLATRRSLEAAIDRTDPGTSESARPANRRYSPLLARAARFAQAGDLWVVATQLPDPLASLFVPIETEARGFDGFLSVRGGLHLEATLETASDNEARSSAATLRAGIPDLPAIARRLKVDTAAANVTLALDVTSEQLAAGLKNGSVPTVAVATAPAAVPAAAAASTPPPADDRPQVIRILGLDDGPREIVLPPVKRRADQ